MGKIKIAIVAFMVMLGSLGVAFALFVFNDPVTADDSLGLVLEGYTEVGTVTLSSPEYFFAGLATDKEGISIDNATAMANHYAIVEVTHKYAEDLAQAPVNGFVYTMPTVELLNEDLAEYLTVSVSAITELGSVAENNETTGSYKVTLSWNANKVPTTEAEYLAFRTIFMDAIADGNELISFTITVAAQE
ncbi:hypothetical protein [Acholeplasma hippikon]|uniref:Uncharacterized protein n=1 Tax=Acholeplasma hippikon TaxID=264636 RepID=A0A449BLE7_9MOLU|nr:hypothetical protein [Acholeplasma hippikon]VEU83256.1 Uncharacterised protein [Acholeplasma hippikon]